MTINTENIRSQMRKGYLEYCVLLILDKNPAYVSDIVQFLKKAHLIVIEGTLYPLLMRLKNGNYLEYDWQESTQGPPRKYYKITPKGKQLIHEFEMTWNELKNVVEFIKKN